jgi:hypothetical protein
VSRESELLERLAEVSDGISDVGAMIASWDDVSTHPTVAAVVGMLGMSRHALMTARNLVDAEHGKLPQALQERRGAWIMTSTGKRFWPLDPRAEDCDVSDITRSLANKCRFNGLMPRFYSVAAHSLNVAAYALWLAAEERALRDDLVEVCWERSIVHDAHEAYLPDVPRPLKRFLHIDRYAGPVQEAIESFLGLGPCPAEVADVVHEADAAVLWLEMTALFPGIDHARWEYTPPESVHRWPGKLELFDERRGKESAASLFAVALQSCVQTEPPKAAPASVPQPTSWRKEAEVVAAPPVCPICAMEGKRVPATVNGLCEHCAK